MISLMRTSYSYSHLPHANLPFSSTYLGDESTLESTRSGSSENTENENPTDYIIKPNVLEQRYNNFMKIRESLTSVYSEMRSRQQANLKKAGTFKSDPFFRYNVLDGRTMQLENEHTYQNKYDPRRCFALSAILHRNYQAEMNWTPAFHELQSRLSNLSGLRFVEDANLYRNQANSECIGQLHWTLMQLVGFADYETQLGQSQSSSFLKPNYLQTIQDSLIEGGLDCAITIHFIGVIAVTTGLLMVGIPSLDANSARDHVRDRLKEQNMPLMEPFLNDIVHSTLFRVVSTDGDETNHYEELMNIANQFENVSLGKVTLQKFQIGPASWRMLDSEMKDTPPAREWTVPSSSTLQSSASTTQSQKNTHTLVQAEDMRFNSKQDIFHSSCYTISGASGASLAKEVRMKLASFRVPVSA